jgi:transposase
MLTLSLTRRQLYELYHEGAEPTIRLIEDLIAQLADFERILGERQQRILDARHERNERQAARLKRVEEKLARKECEVYALTRRLQELQAELERIMLAQGEVANGEVKRDSHNSGLPPSLDLPAAKAQPTGLEVTEHWAQVKRCGMCGARTPARFPRGVNPPVQYGERARSVATSLHKYQLLPMARTGEAMRDLFGCAISPGTIDPTRHRAAAKLVGVEEQIKAGLKAAEVIGADETGLRVAGKSHWIHVARTDYLTHYAADARRGKLAMDAVGILPQFGGVVVRDGWFSYDEYRQATHALCNVHLLRELVYVEEVSAEQQRWTSPRSKLLLDIKAEVERAKGRGETQLSDEQLDKFTARYDRLVRRAARLNPPPVAEKADALAKRYKVVRVKQRDPAPPLIHRSQQRREQVLRFMTDFRVPFDRNERRSQRQRSPVPPNSALASVSLIPHPGWRPTRLGSWLRSRALDHASGTLVEHAVPWLALR